MTYYIAGDEKTTTAGVRRWRVEVVPAAHLAMVIGDLEGITHVAAASPLLPQATENPNYMLSHYVLVSAQRTVASLAEWLDPLFQVVWAVHARYVSASVPLARITHPLARTIVLQRHPETALVWPGVTPSECADAVRSDPQIISRFASCPGETACLAAAEWGERRSDCHHADADAVLEVVDGRVPKKPAARWAVVAARHQNYRYIQAAYAGHPVPQADQLLMVEENPSAVLHLPQPTIRTMLRAQQLGCEHPDLIRRYPEAAFTWELAAAVTLGRATAAVPYRRMVDVPAEQWDRLRRVYPISELWRTETDNERRVEIVRRYGAAIKRIEDNAQDRAAYEHVTMRVPHLVSEVNPAMRPVWLELAAVMADPTVLAYFTPHDLIVCAEALGRYKI